MTDSSTVIPAPAAQPVVVRRTRRRVSGTTVALGALGVGVITAVVAPVLWPLDQTAVDLAAINQPPSFAHPAGLDSLGRDVLHRSLYGLRVSLLVGVVAALVATVVGTFIGGVAAVAGGRVDRVCMRTIDALSSLPHLLVGIFIVAMLRPGLGAVVASVGLTHWLSTARIVRAEILSLRTRTFVDAAISGGATRRRILRRHLLPHVAPQVLLATTLLIPHAIWHETALSFLGLGLPPHLASLGNMVSDGRASLLTGGWWASLAPGAVLVVLALAIATVTGHWRERLNPRTRDELHL